MRERVLLFSLPLSFLRPFTFHKDQPSEVLSVTVTDTERTYLRVGKTCKQRF